MTLKLKTSGPAQQSDAVTATGNGPSPVDSSERSRRDRRRPGRRPPLAAGCSRPSTSRIGSHPAAAAADTQPFAACPSDLEPGITAAQGPNCEELIERCTVVLHDQARPTSLARQAVREICAFGDDQLDDVVLVVNELVVNAVQHTPGPLRMVIERYPCRTLLSVFDPVDEFPMSMRAKVPGPMSQDGRGLQLVEALAERWFVRSAVDGKAVTVQFSSPAR